MAADLVHLQAVLKKFDPINAPNESTLIRYFREELRLFIRAWLDHRRQNLDAWEEVVEKVGDVEAKANLQPTFYVRDINAGARKAIARQRKKTKRTPTKSPAMRPQRTRLSRKPPFPLISLRPRLSKKTSVVVGEAMEAIRLPESMLPR